MMTRLIFVFLLGAVLTPPALAGIWDCKGKPIGGQVYVYELKPSKGNDGLATHELLVHSAQLCEVGGKTTLYNKQKVTNGQMGFFCESEKATDSDLWTVDVKPGAKLPPAFVGFAFKRCQKGDEAKLQASWISHKGAEPHPAHEIEFETDGNIDKTYISTWSNFAFAKPAEEKLKAYLSAYDKHLKGGVASGSGWIAGFWNSCFQEQISAAQSGRPLSDSWMPKAGLRFTADDGLFKVAGVISQSPIRLLIEGPAQADSSIANRCYAVLTLKDKSQLLTTQAPMPGYEVKLGDQIHGFSVRSKGRVNVQMKTIRSLASEAKALPEFELTSEIPMAQRP